MEEAGDVVEVWGAAEWPEEAGADFVADGDDVEGDAVVLEGVGDGEGVVVEGPGEVVDVVVAPGGGCVLWWVAQELAYSHGTHAIYLEDRYTPGAPDPPKYH